jgi:hypothetical protein
MTTRLATTSRGLADAPADRVFTVTRSVVKSLGWDIDKEDRDVGWIRTDSRRLDGDDFGVYAKGVKHRADDRSVEKRILDEIGRSL